MTAWLNTQGYGVERKRVRRWLRLMNLEAIYPKPKLSVPGPNEQRYPYLLRGMTIEHCNPRLELRHYVHPPAARLHLSDGSDGLVQSLRLVVGNLGHAGYEFLLGSS